MPRLVQEGFDSKIKSLMKKNDGEVGVELDTWDSHSGADSQQSLVRGDVAAELNFGGRKYNPLFYYTYGARQEVEDEHRTLDAAIKHLKKLGTIVRVS